MSQQKVLNKLNESTKFFNKKENDRIEQEETQYTEEKNPSTKDEDAKKHENFLNSDFEEHHGNTNEEIWNSILELERSSTTVHKLGQNKGLSAEEIFNNYNNNKYKINQISKDKSESKVSNLEVEKIIPNKIQEHNMTHLRNKTERIIKSLKENQDSRKNKSLLPILEEIVCKLDRGLLKSKREN